MPLYLTHQKPRVIKHLKDIGMLVAALTFVLMIPFSLIAVRQSVDTRKGATGPITPPNGSDCIPIPVCMFTGPTFCTPDEPPEGWCQQSDEDIFFNVNAMTGANGQFEIRDSNNQLVGIHELKRGRTYSYTIDYVLQNKWKTKIPTPATTIEVTLLLNSQPQIGYLSSYQSWTFDDNFRYGTFEGTFVAEKNNTFAIQADYQGHIVEVDKNNNYKGFEIMTGHRPSDANYDQIVDLSDYSLLVQNFFSNNSDSDANSDGFVDLSDYSWMVSEFFKTD